MTRPASRGRRSLLAAVLLTHGCGTSEPVYCGEPCRWTAITDVYVRDTAHQPVAGVEYKLLLFLDVCGSNQDPRAWEYGVTNAQGHQRLLVTALRGPEIMQCVVLTVNPMGNPAYPVGSKEFPAHLEFWPEYGSLRDSMRLEIVVP